jgi:hypothetical protein
MGLDSTMALSWAPSYVGNVSTSGLYPTCILVFVFSVYQLAKVLLNGVVRNSNEEIVGNPRPPYYHKRKQPHKIHTYLHWLLHVVSLSSIPRGI